MKYGQQAVQLTNSSEFDVLHTLACIYAFQDKTTEARDLLLKAMNAANQAVPSTEIWFALGMIYQQYGLNDAATEAFSKVEKPDDPVLGVSTYVLAQQRLAALRTPQTKGTLAQSNR